LVFAILQELYSPDAGFRNDLEWAEEAAEKLMWAGFSRAEAREKHQKERTCSARLKPCPFKTSPLREFFRSL
jgi:hypothetical protein